MTQSKRSNGSMTEGEQRKAVMNYLESRLTSAGTSNGRTANLTLWLGASKKIVFKVKNGFYVDERTEKYVWVPSVESFQVTG